VLKKDRISSLLFLLFSLYVCWQSIELGFGTFAKPGPGFLSLLAGISLGLLSLVIFFGALTAKKTTEDPPRQNIPWLPLLVTFGCLVGFTLLMTTLGFNLTTFLFIGILLRVVANKSWVLSLSASLAITLGTYVIFELFLQSQLPEGLLGF
jgi:putative tricarboxylic transport membrane protein